MITRKQFESDFNKFVAAMKIVLMKKNHDYTAGNDNEDPLFNFRRAGNIGIPYWKGAYIRFSDKVSRIETFAKKEKYEVDDENFEDTIRDAANYLFIILELYKEENDKKEQKNKTNSAR